MPSWYTEQDKEGFKGAWDALPDYCEAKTNVDEYFYTESRKRGDGKAGGWEDIDLRPGTLTDDKGRGKVGLGKVGVGKVSREDVGDVAVRLLEAGGAGGLWVDLVEGDEEAGEAVERVVKGRITTRA